MAFEEIAYETLNVGGVGAPLDAAFKLVDAVVKNSFGEVFLVLEVVAQAGWFEADFMRHPRHV